MLLAVLEQLEAKNKHKKTIHRPRLTINNKEKRLEYARHYQNISAKEWRNVVLSDEKNYSRRHSRGGSLMIGGGSHFQKNLNYNFSVVDKKQQIIWRR